MIDLHCHMLPGIDDGAPDMDRAVEMARIAVTDGIRTVACTPHIYPGLYENSAAGIQEAVTAFRERLEEAGIDLQLTYGADTHLAPDLVKGLREGHIPTLNGSRYFLLEPPHHVAPPRFEDSVFGLMAAGYVPVITHPERLTWVEDSYDVFVRLARRGAWMQVTSGSLTGRFGESARYWGERFLNDGLVHILATDAHSTGQRAPLLSEGRLVAERCLGAEEASHMVTTRPAGILADVDPERLPVLPGLTEDRPRRGKSSASLFRRLFQRN